MILYHKEKPGHDHLYKIRPLIEQLNKNFKKVLIKEYLAIDKQICPTKARTHLKRYVPSKSHKWGYELFVLYWVSGYAYSFEIDSGQEDDSSRGCDDEPDLGTAENHVVYIVRADDNDNDILFMLSNIIKYMQCTMKHEKETRHNDKR